MRTIQIKTELGIIEGELKSECMIFRGVPYAEAPIGERRFKMPSKKAGWEGVLNCLEFSMQCPQADPRSGFYGKEFYTDDRFPLPKMDEDCLYLNIWAPRKKGNYPVAFWIHGGAFDHGFSSEMEFDGEKFASNGVILVSINYRVGVFGFFADGQLARENNFRTTGNYGLLDQIMALRWVYDNIDSFGGDRERITVFGQSAGAMSVEGLICSPLTKGLIHSAIMQSGGGYKNSLTHAKKMEEAYAVSEDIKRLCKAKTIKEMRKVSSETLVSILPQLYQLHNGLAFGPVIDGYVLKEDMDAAIVNNRVHDIPYMLGITANDITINEGEDARKSDLFKGCAEFANQRNVYSKKPVYLYYFARRLPSDDAGAFHSSELWYVFGTLDRCWRKMESRDYRISEAMIKAWTNFMKTGSPDDQWRPYTRKKQFVRTFM